MSNSYLLYQKNNKNNKILSRKDYRLNIIEGLSGNIVFDNRLGIDDCSLGQNKDIKNCSVCSTKEKKIRTCYYCSTCQVNVCPLCYDNHRKNK